MRTKLNCPAFFFRRFLLGALVFPAVVLQAQNDSASARTRKDTGAVTFNAADLMIFNTALTDQEVAAKVCLKNVQDHPRYQHLIGYWPLDDGFGGKANNLAPGATTPLNFSGNFKWAGLSDFTCNRLAVSPVGKTSLLVKNTDVVTTAFYWLRLPVNSTWGLEGATWLQQYEIEFVKI